MRRVLVSLYFALSFFNEALSLTPLRPLYRFWLHAICIRVHTTDAPRSHTCNVRVREREYTCAYVRSHAGLARCGAQHLYLTVNFRQICGARMHVRYDYACVIAFNYFD